MNVLNMKDYKNNKPSALTETEKYTLSKMADDITFIKGLMANLDSKVDVIKNEVETVIAPTLAQIKEEAFR